MYYVIGYLRSKQQISAFLATDQRDRALRTRYLLECESLQYRVSSGEPWDEEVVVIGTPDLFTLQERYQRYFPAQCQHFIADCFFCRSTLGQTDPPSMDRIEILSLNAKLHGHCLLCHCPYPVHYENSYHLDEGLIFHLDGHCPVLDLANDHGPVDSV